MLQTVTSATLLRGLEDADNRTVWSEYVGRYRPTIVRYLERIGLTASDAEDVAQDALLAFATAYRQGKYDPAKGRLRSWLFGIAHTTLRNHNRRKPREVQAGSVDGTDFFARVEDEDRLAEIWEDEWRQAVLRQCFAEVRGEVQQTTFEAFDLFANRQWPAEKVARHLGITENAVYGAKRRVLGRIRQILPRMQEDW